MERMIIQSIVHETDRILLFGVDRNYHLIADTNDDVKVGDTVEYEPDGVNFGWFKRVVISKAVR